MRGLPTSQSLADRTTDLATILRVQAFAGGLECTVGGTIFEMWLGNYQLTKAVLPKS